MTDFYRKPRGDLTNFKCEQTVIINKKYINNISRLAPPRSCTTKQPDVDWYPFTNSFYPFTEDVDIYARVNHLLSTHTPSQLARQCQNCACANDGYSEKQAQLQYLTSNPTSFLILGKSGIGENHLGKLLADYWNCVYIEPETLIRQELENQTDAGKCIEFNLRNGRAIGADVVMKLVQKRVKSETAQHRGFVVCGFPMIHNDLFEEDPVTVESALFNVQGLFDDVLENVIEIGVPPEIKSVHGEFDEEEAPTETIEEEGEELKTQVENEPTTPIDLGSDTSEVCVSGIYEKNIEEQLHFLFGLFEKPFVVVYVVCGNPDVVSKHKSQLFDVNTQQMVDLQLEEADRVIYTYFSQVPGVGDDEIPQDLIDTVKNSDVVYNVQEQRVLVSLPKDFSDNMVTVLDRYRHAALPTIEDYILKHDLQNLIRVDGRISPVRMFHAVKERLKILPIQKVVVPERFSMPKERGVEGTSQDNLNFEDLTMEECFALLAKKNVPSSMFKWSLSDWGFRCPVLLKQGVEKDGDPNCAVHFMNKIFFLANEECVIKFRRNPRPFLLPLCPKPAYKICVMGPSCSGKSSVAKCLAYLYDSALLKYEKMVQEFLLLRLAGYEATVRAKALKSALKLLNEKRTIEWEEKETARLEKFAAWDSTQKALVSRIIKLKKAILKSDNVIVLEISSFPTKLSYKEDVDPNEPRDSLDGLEVETLRAMLQECLEASCLPESLSLSDLEELLTDDKKIYEYAPEELLPDCGPIPASPSDDFVVEYVEDAMLNASFADTGLTIEDKILVLTDGVKKAEQERGSWVVDGILPERELFKALYPENTPLVIILLKDDKHQYLVSQYPFRGHNEYDTFKKLFYEIGHDEVAWRAPSLTSTYNERTVAQVLEDLIDDAMGTINPEDAEEHKLVTLEAYKKELDNFDKEFASVSGLLRDQKIELINVSITNKPIEVVLKETVGLIENRYRQVASEFTQMDRAQELEDIGEPDLLPEETADGEEKDDNEEMLMQNRRFGDTFNYCPVAFHDHFVLWRGKDDFIVKFDNKIYMLSSKTAMQKFLAEPRRFLTLEKPPDEFPPVRVCVVGPYGSGKDTVAESLSRNLGLYRYNYEKLLKKEIAPDSRLTLHEVLKYGIGGSTTLEARDYMLNNHALDEPILEKITDRLWFGEYEKMYGFVLSGFPKRAFDVQFMTQHCTIPDVVIELSINQGELRNRLIPKRLAELKQVSQEERRQEIVSNWEKQYEIRYQELLLIKKAEKLNEEAENRPYMADLAEVDEVTDEVPETEEMIQEVKEILAVEMPKPKFPVMEENAEACVNEFENQSTKELGFLRAIKELCQREMIPWMTIDAGLSKEKVFAQAMRVVEKYKFRNRSLFERVYEVSDELADKLLSSGYFFLSKFGMTCPVQVYADFNPLQMYLPCKQQFQLYPATHRQYVYFLAKEENLKKFKEDPLKYVEQKFVEDPLLPLRVAVIGPPKSGKTTLAMRFKRDLGMQVISRGRSCRYVMNYLKFSEIAGKVEAGVRTGEELTDDVVIKAVEACSYDGRCITQGFVLDGFPENVSEVRQLAALGLVPHLVIDLRADLATVRRFRCSTVGKKGVPAYSEMFIDHRYETYSLHDSDFRKWLDKEYQNNAAVVVKVGKWGVWNQCLDLVLAAFSEIKCYHRYAFSDNVLRLSYMQVTPLEFIERRSLYKHYCPCCLFFENVLESGGNPPDRTGLVQFRMYFYYICPKHIDLFVEDPERFISPYNPRELPTDVPQHVATYDAEPYAEGNCIICYWTNQPKYVVTPGHADFAVTYRETIYLFDTNQCLTRFMREPHLYYTIKITYNSNLSLQDLPIQGFLQQYDAQKLIKAITNTGILRPVIPGLSINKSACLNIALHLVVNNPKTSPKRLELYKEAQRKFNEKRTNLLDYLSQMKKVINPYLYYDEPMPKFVDPLLSPRPSSSGSKTENASETN